MKKSLIIPIFGLFILGVSTFFFFDKKEERENKNVALPSSLFNTADFYDMKTLNQKEMSVKPNFYFLFLRFCQKRKRR